jgi:hypothetical protein
MLGVLDLTDNFLLILFGLFAHFLFFDWLFSFIFSVYHGSFLSMSIDHFNLSDRDQSGEA